MGEKKKTWEKLIPVRYKESPRVFSELYEMFEDFKNEFKNMFLNPFGFIRPFSEPITPLVEMPREPLVYIADLGDKFELTAEIPCIPKDKINILVSSGKVYAK